MFNLFNYINEVDPAAVHIVIRFNEISNTSKSKSEENGCLKHFLTAHFCHYVKNNVFDSIEEISC